MIITLTHSSDPRNPWNTGIGGAPSHNDLELEWRSEETIIHSIGAGKQPPDNVFRWANEVISIYALIFRFSLPKKINPRSF